MNVTISHNTDKAFHSLPVELPPSKSIAIRVMIMAAYSGRETVLSRTPDCDDCRFLNEALKRFTNGEDTIYIGMGAAPLRFILPFIALRTKKKITIVAQKSLLSRPIQALLDYIERLFPVRTELIGHVDFHHDCGAIIVTPVDRRLTIPKTLEIETKITSQFLSSIMMAASQLPEPIDLLFSSSVSEPYIAMTRTIMEEFGIKSEIIERKGIRIFNSKIAVKSYYEIESDWSQAAFFYEAATICPDLTIVIKNLKIQSLQGDAVLPDLFYKVGIKTEVSGDDIIISSNKEKRELICRSMELIEFQMIKTPDLVPPLAVALSLSGISFRINGVSHLRHKESDRIKALQNSLSLLKIKLRSGENYISYEKNDNICDFHKATTIDPSGDHRIAMAMAFAPLATPPLIIKDAECVAKSFPGFWKILPKTVPLTINRI